MNEPIWTTKEAAAALNLSAETLRYWRHLGKGPRSFHLGRRAAYLPSDVAAWVQAQYAASNPDVA